MKRIKRFDMVKKPIKERWYLTPIARLLSLPTTKSRKLEVTKVNMEGLKPPYILLCTHHAFIDFKVQRHAIYPYPATYVVAVDGFIGKEWLLRRVGGIGKRKFTPQDTILFKQIKYSLEALKQITTLYPEASYSINGTPSILPDSLAKMIKIFKHPIVVLNMHGNFLTQPFWQIPIDRKVIPLRADLTQIITKDEITQISVEEVDQRIRKAFEYDEWKYQFDNQIIIDHPQRAEGLNRVLYQCMECGTEHQMQSKGTKIWCEACGVEHELTELGRLKRTDGQPAKYVHVPDWYEKQRETVVKQLQDGSYHFEDDVYVDSLPNAKGYIKLKDGTHLSHNKDGFHLTGTDLEGPLDLFKETASLYNVHIEFNFKRSDNKYGDAIILSTLDDTYYCYPKNKKDVVAKIRFAVEEAFKMLKEKKIEV